MHGVMGAATEAESVLRITSATFHSAVAPPCIRSCCMFPRELHCHYDRHPGASRQLQQNAHRGDRAAVLSRGGDVLVMWHGDLGGGGTAATSSTCGIQTMDVTPSGEHRIGTGGGWQLPRRTTCFLGFFSARSRSGWMTISRQTWTSFMLTKRNPTWSWTVKPQRKANVYRPVIITTWFKSIFICVYRATTWIVYTLCEWQYVFSIHVRGFFLSFGTNNHFERTLS